MRLADGVLSGASLHAPVPSHAPSEARSIRRAIRTGEGDPEGLLGQARALEPAHAAPALALLASDARLDADIRAEAARDAARMANQVKRVGQKAEVWSEVLKALGAAGTVAAVDEAVADVEAMPDGEWTHAAIAALAAHVGPGGRRRLLARALRNPGFEADGAKAVLDAADKGRETGLVDAASAAEDPDVRRRVLGHLHHAGAAGATGAADAVEAAWDVPDREGRLEALRALAYQCQDADALDQAAASIRGRDPDEAARLLCALAARADRLGHRGRMESWLAHALDLAEALDAKPRRKVAGKVATAMEKAGLDPAPAVALAAGAAAPAEAQADRPPTRTPPTPGPTLAPRSGHTMRLVDAYEGGLGLAHLRAASRAAALCAAFGHDLVLVAFPASDLAAFVEAAAAETSIGEDARPLRLLLEDGRLALVADPLDVGDGTVVATTPHPDPEKAVHLEGLRGPLTLAIGLGRRGLPQAVLAGAQHHYELTGRGVSLETATAMGILADRLARVPATP